MDRWGEFWRFTDKALDRALRETCPAAAIDVRTWGNLAASKGYLDGVPAEAFPTQCLDVHDRDYQMLLTACVVRPADAGAPLAPGPVGAGCTGLPIPDHGQGMRGFARENRNGARRRQASLARELAVVVRSVGERTSEACLALLRRELPEENIAVVRNIPFDQAVCRTFELGLQSGRPWVLALDSDMLLRPSALLRMVETAYTQPENVFAIWTMALDKAFRVYRPVGMHLYRASLLARARERSEGRDLAGCLRPESAMVDVMRNDGCLAAQTDLVVGLHDYKQAYRDLLTKGCVHARKHAAIVALLRPLWRDLARRDPDYAALLRGADFGERYAGKIAIDHAALTKLTAEELAAFGRPEKPAFVPGPDLPDMVEATLGAMEGHPDRQRLQPLVFPEHFWNRLDGNVG